MSDPRPADFLAPSIAVLRRRATLASLGLGAVMAARGWDVLGRAWTLVLLGDAPRDGRPVPPELMQQLHRADAMVDGGNVLLSLTLVVCAVLFLRWVHRLVKASRSLGAHLQWKPGDAVWAFIIPIISLFRPFQVMRDVLEQLAPERVAAPALRVDPAAQSDYRGTRFVEPPPPRAMPAALVGVWWGCFIVMNIGVRIVTSVAVLGPAKTYDSVVRSYEARIVLSVLAVGTAALAITLVRALTARAEERFRRIQASTPEALYAQQIELAVDR